MNWKYFYALLPYLAFASLAHAQGDTLNLSSSITSITINWTWQAQNGDTTTRDFCLLEFALPAEKLAEAYCFKLGSLRVEDDSGRAYKANAFAVTAGGQSLHRNFRMIDINAEKGAGPRFRVRIENPKKDIEYFSLEGELVMVDLSLDPNSVQQYSTLNWQSLYENLLPYDIQLVFAAQGRSMMEQMANLGGMSPEGQGGLNTFMETNSMYLQEPLFPEHSNLLLADPDKQVLKVEPIGPEGQPVPHQERRSYFSGLLYLQQQYEGPLSGQEQVKVVVATPANQVNIPIRMERVVLPW